jgi:hypothetical protein
MMSPLRSFTTYYVRSALPFLTGLVFGVFLFRFDFPLVWEVVAGLVLVVAGPLAIQAVLVLMVEALRGSPGESGRVRLIEGAPALDGSFRREGTRRPR